MKGHVRKRGNKWCFVIDIGRKPDGSRNRKWFSGYNTKKEAEKDLTDMLHELNSGSFVEPSKELFSDYMERWMEYKMTRVRPGTFRHYKWLVNNHIIPGLGKIKLSELRPLHIQQYYTQLETSGKLSERSMLHLHRTIYNALDRAVKWGLITKNVAQSVDPPRPKKSNFAVWDEDQVRHFLAVAKNDRFYVAFLLALTTGMRKGEILGLRWQDVDFVNRSLSVRQTLGYNHSGYRIQEPKSDSSYRTISLPQEVVDELRRHKVGQAEEKLKAELYQDMDLVISTRNGNFVSPRNLTRSWERLLKESGLPKIRFHDLRHTHASILLKQGAHPKIVSERLGHSNIGITLDTYSHILPGLQEEVAKQFGESIFSPKNTNKNSL